MRERRVDLWRNMPLPGKEQESLSGEAKEVLPDSSKFPVNMDSSDIFVSCLSNGNLRVSAKLGSIPPKNYEDFDVPVRDDGKKLFFECTANDTNVLALSGYNEQLVFTDTRSEEKFRKLFHNIDLPCVSLENNGKNVDVDTRGIRYYARLLYRLGAYPKGNGVYRLPVGRVFELELLCKANDNYPSPVFSPEVQKVLWEPIPGFDGHVESLKNVPLSVLNIVQANSQTWKERKKSSKTLEEKLRSFGLETVYDALTFLPRRYIDKTRPQSINNLVAGETATITGVVERVVELPNQMGVKFIVRPPAGRNVDATFWRQNWLSKKFSVNDEVIITGKLGFWKKKPQLNGSSIDHADEVAALPIVPIYRQSESKGITTKLLLNIVREIISRLGEFNFPKYFPSKVKYSDVLREIHFPSSLNKHYAAVEKLAELELTLMQVLLLHDEQERGSASGVALPVKQGGFVDDALKGLPFDLTGDQARVVQEVREVMSTGTPGAFLLNADVGAGKTLVAQMLCLHTADSGFQSLFVAPTDVLAKQVYENFVKLLSNLNNPPTVELYTGSLSQKEKTRIKGAVKNGDVNILVGTHATIGKTMKYHNLGFVAVDEQQKFGTEQRTQILHSRKDGLVPHVVMMSATPIPRSIAQVFYGGLSMLELKDKPPGRKEIVTEWVEEDPMKLLETTLHPVWLDVSDEVKKGNQVFIVTPLVETSAKIEATSVKETFELVRKIFGKDRVGIAHGGMKPQDVHDMMQRFRNKDFNILVASSIVEVGVDIPDATRMVVLSAERFGSSSLHQIRGRVGRSSKESKCFLVSAGNTESSQARLQSLVDFTDGFSVARADLSLRGEGYAFGAQQHGANDMIFANIGRHAKKIPRARKRAERILHSPLKDIALRDASDVFDTFERLI